MDIQDRLLEAKQLIAINDLPNTTDKRMEFWTEKDSARYVKRELCKAKLIYNNPIPDLETIPPNEIVGVDFETTGFNPRVNRIIGLGVASKSKQFFIWGKYSVIKEVIEWLNANRVLTAHNGKFENKFSIYQLGIEFNLSYDSMLMQYILHSGLSKELAACAERELGRSPLHFVELCRPHNPPYTKDADLDINLVPIQEIGDYCAEDCLESALLVPIYLNRMNPQQRLLHEIEVGTSKLLAHTELQGIAFDTDKAIKLSREYTETLDIIRGEIYNCAGVEFSINSNQQLSEVLFEHLGLPTEGVKVGKTGAYSVDKATLSRFEGYKIIDLLLEYRQIQKLTKDFCINLLNRAYKNEGVVYTNFNQAGAITGRLSSSDPNLQNIPNANRSLLGKQIRSMFVAREGKMLIKADYSQFELRILAHLSNDPYLIEGFKQGLDIHVVVTELIFGIQYDPNNPLHKTLRTICKNLNFGLVYGMTPHRLFNECIKVGLKYTLEQCEEIFNTYWQKLPGVAYFLDKIRLDSIVLGYSESIMGRRRHFTYTHPYLNALRGKTDTLARNPSDFMKYLESIKVIKYDDAANLREATNHAIQGSNADTIKLVMSTWYNEGYHIEAPILLTVHDEIVIEVDTDLIGVYCDRLQSVMTNAVSLKVPVVVDPTVSEGWSIV